MLSNVAILCLTSKKLHLFIWDGPGGSLLCLSCLFGLISKIYGLLCRVGLDTTDAVTETFDQHLQKYSEVEDEIQETAKVSGITIETGVRIERIKSEFMRGRCRHL